MSEVKDLTVLNVDGKDVSDREASARKERIEQVMRLTFLLNITQVGEHTCKYAVNLTVVHLPEGIAHILKAAYFYCKNLTYVRFPKSLISIGKGSFNSCSNLGEVDLRDTNLQEVGERAFGQCKNLTSIFIPDSLQKLGPHVFDRCPKLVPSNIDVKDSNAVVAYLRWKLMASLFILVAASIQLLTPHHTSTSARLSILHHGRH